MKFIHGDPSIKGKIALVGNSGSLKNSGLGNAIDSHDYVIRFNRAVTNGFEKDIGAKTSLRAVNLGTYMSLPVARWHCDITFIKKIKNANILLYKHDYKKQNIYKQRNKFIDESNNLFYIEYKELRKTLAEKFNFHKGPSIGMSLVFIMIFNDIIPTIYGFDVDKRPRDHYWEKRNNFSSHNVNLEKKLLNNFIESGKIIYGH